MKTDLWAFCDCRRCPCPGLSGCGPTGARRGSRGNATPETDQGSCPTERLPHQGYPTRLRPTEACRQTKVATFIWTQGRHPDPPTPTCGSSGYV
jgi:hypothetical protein